MLDDWDNLRVCEVCRDRECVAPATKCDSCLTQEMIDDDRINDTEYSMKNYVCMSCLKEYDYEPEYCHECGAEVWTREEVEAWQGVDDDE